MQSYNYKSQAASLRERSQSFRCHVCFESELEISGEVYHCPVCPALFCHDCLDLQYVPDAFSQCPKCDQVCRCPRCKNRRDRDYKRPKDGRSNVMIININHLADPDTKASPQSLPTFVSGPPDAKKRLIIRGYRGRWQKAPKKLCALRTESLPDSLPTRERQQQEPKGALVRLKSDSLD
eukprot:TRINITY_DN5541_c0_g1_i1.p2 TRINITY_DN5541_c0_g1~~TRINITY_DN5541_c0_g1_i1.p2  ORF type:complete len:179 (+),score=26.97 TRINITY_DN5541_c0_g1_i1:63-599(+)